MADNTEKKGFFKKFFGGIKSFFVKTARVNGSHCIGFIDGIGDFLVYDDHALISALGMDDVTFKRENVTSYNFEGLGKIRKKKATVKYTINLDDNVVFPEKVREKNDVKKLTAVIFVENEKTRFWGKGQVNYGNAGVGGLFPYENCNVYGYDDCFVIAVNLERRNGDNVEKYQESVLYPFDSIKSISGISSKSIIVNFDDEKSLSFTAANESVCEKLASIEIK